jgi:hypothetical protein
MERMAERMRRTGAVTLSVALIKRLRRSIFLGDPFRLAQPELHIGVVHLQRLGRRDVETDD